MTSTAVHPAFAGRTAVPWLPALVALACASASAAALVLVTADGGWNLAGARDLPVDAAVGIAYAAAALLVLAGSGGRRIGMLMLVVGIAGSVTALTTAYTLQATERTGAVVVAAMVQSSLWVLGFMPLLTLLPLVYPTGDLPGPRWRPALVGSVIGMALLVVACLVYPQPVEGRITVDRPWTFQRPGELLFLAAGAVLLPSVLACLAAPLARLRAARGLQRRQLVVLLVTAVLLALDTAVQPLLAWPATGISQAVAVALVPLAVGVAVTRHRLYDLDLALCRTITGVSLALCLAGVYLTLFALTAALLPDRTTLGAAFAAAVTGLLVHPLGVRLTRGVDRLFYGDRGTPQLVLSRLSSGLREGLDMAEVPGHVCRGIVESLQLGSASLSLGDDPDAAPVAGAGEPGGPLERLPLRHRGEVVAVLRVSPRPGEVRLDPRDRELLEAAADQVAPAIAALRLSERLQQSRAALVTAREEERRRLRRDLHDGAGAALAGLRLQVESARERVEDPVAGGLLDSAARGVAAVVDDLRAITDDLRPATLDDLGLEGGLRSLAERASTPSTCVDARIEVPDGLPAAVEVACYRIAAEALANAVRHAAATRVRLALAGSVDGVVLEVSDDGRGMPPQVRPGALGLASMRQRAEEIGGTLQVDSGAAGTTVRAHLPRELR